MGYCRMENTYNDLKDAFNHFYDENLSDSEKEYKNKIIKLASDIHFGFAEDSNNNEDEGD